MMILLNSWSLFLHSSILRGNTLNYLTELRRFIDQIETKVCEIDVT